MLMEQTQITSDRGKSGGTKALHMLVKSEVRVGRESSVEAVA